MALETWLLHVATCFAATFTPGPAVLMTMSSGALMIGAGLGLATPRRH